MSTSVVLVNVGHEKESKEKKEQDERLPGELAAALCYFYLEACPPI